MSTKRNRGKLNKAANGSEYHKMWIKENFDPYWDEGILFYPKYKKGFKNPNRRLMRFQIRMYRTWKHNRLTKWKQ